MIEAQFGLLFDLASCVVLAGYLESLFDVCCVRVCWACVQVIILKNMVVSEELQLDEEFGEICDDVRDECAQYGRVLCVLVPRAKEGFPAQCEGSVFVEFGAAVEARTAALALCGRKFADRTVDVDYFDEIKFTNRTLL